MGMRQLETALTLLRANPGRIHVVGPRSETVVTSAESALGLTLPPTYRRFVTELGAASVGSEEIDGIIDEDFEHSGIPDAIWYTLKLRSESSMPNNLVAIYSVGDGEILALDTSRTGVDGEAPVVAWTPGGSRPSDHLEVVAPDFGTFLLERVRAAVERLRQ